jgi:hypothetical protein
VSSARAGSPTSRSPATPRRFDFRREGEK